MPKPKPKAYQKTKSTTPVNPLYDRDNEEDVAPKRIPDAKPLLEGRRSV